MWRLRSTRRSGFGRSRTSPLISLLGPIWNLAPVEVQPCMSALSAPVKPQPGPRSNLRHGHPFPGSELSVDGAVLFEEAREGEVLVGLGPRHVGDAPLELRVVAQLKDALGDRLGHGL